MNQFQRLTRRLTIMAESRDRRGAQEMLDELSRHDGWGRDLTDYIARMRSPERMFVRRMIDESPPPGDRPGGGDYRSGRAAGALAAMSSSMSGVSQDATSLIYCPATAAEWATTIAAAALSAGPSFLYLCQEATGNLADTIGGAALVVTGTPAYQQAIAGWTRKALVTTDASSQQWASTSASLPDISTTSFLLLMYMGITGAPSAQHVLAAMGITAARYQVSTASKIVTTSPGSTATAANALSGVNPCVLKVDRTNSAVKGYTLADIITPTFGGTMTGKKLVLGGDSASATGPGQYLYAAAFSGAAAELTDSQIRTLMQTLGWSPSW